MSIYYLLRLETLDVVALGRLSAFCEAIGWWLMAMVGFYI
jgi:hypothetical protein